MNSFIKSARLAKAFIRQLQQKETQPPHRTLTETTLQDGTWVSTVRLPVPHGTDTKNPLFWETVVFYPHGETVLFDRYAREEDARAGHDRVVRLLITNRAEQ